MEPLSYAPLDIGRTERGVRKRRLWDLVFVLGVTFVPIIISSIFAFAGKISNDYAKNSIDVVLFLQTLEKMVFLAVLFYVLFHQGRGLRTIGYSFEPLDILRTIALFFGLFAVMIFFGAVLKSLAPVIGRFVEMRPRNLEFLRHGRLSLALIFFLIVNGFFEELLVRAFAMTEIEFLTGSPVLAIVLSVVIQTSYHIYQGLFPLVGISLMFLVFSLYFQRTRRIVPVIWVHIIWDMIMVLKYAKW